MKTMLWLGITGGLGTGKSTFSNLLRSRGYQVIDADQLARAAIVPGGPLEKEVLQCFGPAISINTEQGHAVIDRGRLAQVVFSDPVKLKDLEKIIHPWVRVEVERLRKDFESKGESMLFYDVPLMFEKNLQDQFDQVIVVKASPKIVLERIKLRNPDWSEEEIRKRISNQLPLSSKISTFEVWNDSDMCSLELKVDQILDQLKGLIPS